MAVQTSHRPLAPLTTWRVGGPALRFVEPRTTEEIVDQIRQAQQADIPWTMLGRGSNLLIADEGFSGLVVRLCEHQHDVRVVRSPGSDVPDDFPFDGPCVVAQAGASNSAVVKAAMEQGLGGLSFLSSIPGSVGGAVYMNAGAHGAETSDVLIAARIARLDGTIAWQTPADLAMRYRHSAIQDDGGIVLAAAFGVRPQPASDVRREILELAQWRRQRQPQDPSAGSVFRNPPGDSAGRLIEASGLKGFSLGGAMVSPVHANFIVNTGAATARDINRLIIEIRRRVWQIHGVTLIPEVRGLGLTVGVDEVASSR